MPQPNEQTVNPFTAAKVNTTDIRVEWTISDIRELMPDWPPDRCRRFLERHRDKFAAGILRVGLDMLRLIAADPDLGADLSSEK